MLRKLKIWTCSNPLNLRFVQFSCYATSCDSPPFRAFPCRRILRVRSVETEEVYRVGLADWLTIEGVQRDRKVNTAPLVRSQAGPSTLRTGLSTQHHCCPWTSCRLISSSSSSAVCSDVIFETRTWRSSHSACVQYTIYIRAERGLTAVGKPRCRNSGNWKILYLKSVHAGTLSHCRCHHSYRRRSVTVRCLLPAAFNTAALRLATRLPLFDTVTFSDSLIFHQWRYLPLNPFIVTHVYYLHYCH
jgi:hypothetical protein